MYYIERNIITDAMFLAGSVAEPSPTETVWAPGAWAVGAEVIRPSIHRVFRCAVERNAGHTNPPELDTNSWTDMRATDRYRPFGPHVRADGKLVYEGKPLQSTTGNIVFCQAQRFADAVAIFGAKGGTWRVQVYNKPVAEGGVLTKEYTGRIKSPATGYKNYAYGQRYTTDRILVHGMPIFPNAEVRVSIEGSGSQLRAVSQIEVGKLRYIPGIHGGGVEYGLLRSPRVFTATKTEPDGSTSVLIYGYSDDMSGTVAFSGKQEDPALVQFRRLLGRGVAYAPTLFPGYQQSLGFGILTASDVSRNESNDSSARFEIKGLKV